MKGKPDDDWSDWTGWRPRDFDGVGNQERLRTKPDGTVRLENMSNWLAGHATSWGLLVLAVFGLNERGSMSGSDPMSVSEVLLVGVSLFLASTCINRVIATPHAVLSECRIVVVNPVRVHRVPLSEVVEIREGFWFNQPVLVTARRRVSVAALEQGLHHVMAGGLVEVAIIRRRWEQCQEQAVGQDQVVKSWRGVDRSLVALWACWSLYALAFALPGWL